jgi:SAM-dependent methyltransferase
VRLRKGELTLRRCADCGHVQVDPVPDAAALQALYAEQEKYAEQLTWDEPMFVARDRAVVAALAADGASGPLVDVGAGAGLMLQAAVERGWQAIGIELSVPNARLIRDRLGVSVHVGDLDDAPLEPGSVGAITFSHSLEHLRDPVGTLRRARELLRPGGLVFVAVPNWAAATRVLTGPHITWINHEHISYFDQRSLQRAFVAAGLAPLRFETRRFLGVSYDFVLAVVRRFGLEPLCQRFLRLNGRTLDQLLANDVQIACPPWRLRALIRFAHGLLWLWPEGLFCTLGRGQELRGVARRE